MKYLTTVTFRDHAEIIRSVCFVQVHRSTAPIKRACKIWQFELISVTFQRYKGQHYGPIEIKD